MKKLLPIILPLALLVSSSTLTSAKEEITTAAIPPRLEITAKAGETIRTQLKIRNESDSTLLYSVSVDDFIVSDTEGTPIPVTEDVSARWSMKRWIKAPELIPVDAHKSQVVNLTINVPSDALPGGHYAMVTYQPNPDSKMTDLKKTGSLIGQRTGSLLYMTVAGPINQNASLIRFFTSKFHEFGPIKIEGLISNSSDVHVNAKGNIIIKDFLGNKVATLPIETGNIFPEASRSFESIWNQKWGYGRYTANLELAYGTAGGIIVGSLFFWLFPIRLVIYILTLIIAILFIIITLNKRNRHHQQELESEVAALKEELERVEQQK